MKDEYRKVFANYDKNGLIKSTTELKLSNEKIYEDVGGEPANKTICLDNPYILIILSLTILYYLTCSLSALRLKTYLLAILAMTLFVSTATQANQERIQQIKPDGVGKRRQPKYETPEVLLDLKCTIHTHALAYTTCEKPWPGILVSCQGGTFDNDPHNNYVCVTDNPFECASYYSLREFKDDQPVELRTISYRDFCLDQNYVCAKGKGIYFNNCPQNGYDSQKNWYSSTVTSINMPIGYYCSLFGNDIDIIRAVDAGRGYDIYSRSAGPDTPGIYSYKKDKYSPLIVEGQEATLGWFGYEDNDTVYIQHPHMPMINRDSNEKLYHLLWNYESCKRVYGDEITFTCSESEKKNKDSNVYWTRDKDWTGVPSYPVFHFLGTYEYPKLNKGDEEYVVSQEFCKVLWKTLNWDMQEFNLNDFKSRIAEIKGSITLKFKNTEKEFEKEQIKKYIDISCKYWYDPLLRAYYDENVKASDTGLEINPPIIQWGSIKDLWNWGILQKEYTPLDFTYFYDHKNFCFNNEIIEGKKCMQNYPDAIIPNYNVDKKPDGSFDWKREDTCDCIPRADGTYPKGCI